MDPSDSGSGLTAFVTAPFGGFAATALAGAAASLGQTTGPAAIGPRPTKFYVVDQQAGALFRYDAAGNPLASTPLADPNPRGDTSNAAGDTVWVIDANGDVFDNNTDGSLRGSWTAAGVADPRGIATDGTNLWILDGACGTGDDFASSATRLAGSQAPTASFVLASGSTNPAGLSTDGTTIWILDDTSRGGRVFVYDTSGTPLGSWDLDPRQTEPVGITLALPPLTANVGF